MDDRYRSNDECVDRLYNEYLKYNSLYIAFDFDNTIYDFHNRGDKYPLVIGLLRKCKKLNFKLILFTCSDKIEDKIKYCVEIGIKPDFVNESPIFQNSIKPYYNLLLDDRAGLDSSTLILELVLEKINHNE